MIDDIKKDAQTRMKKSVDSLRQDLTRIRTGRASPALLDQVMVDYYGTRSPLSQVATIAVGDARTLTVHAWERKIIPLIEKAIHESNLGLNPVTAGEIIRIPLPPMTEERRREMTRLVRHEGENAKVAIRNIRRDAIQTTRELLKEKEVSEDAAKHAENDYQQITDRFVGDIDQLVTEKESEVMEV